MDIIAADQLSREALDLDAGGDLKAAEIKHLAALQIRKDSESVDPIGVATTENLIGEFYLKMGELEKAEQLLESANQVLSKYENFDASCTANNLGRLYEMKGMWRLLNAPDRMICSNLMCARSKLSFLSKRDALKSCEKCKCVFYCKRECQKADWSRHQHFCKVPDEATTPNTTEYMDIDI